MNRKEHDKKYYEKNKELVRVKQSEYYEINKANVLQKNKEYSENNKGKIKQSQAQYRALNKDKAKEYGKAYREQNKNTLRAKKRTYINTRRANDKFFKLKGNLGTNLYHAMSKKGYTKKSKLFQVIGCTFEEFKTYIENQFEDWMTWDNYGIYEKDKFNIGWDIDHIKPTSLAKTEDGIYDLFHYSNLTPLCSKVNRDIKKDAI